MIVLFWILFALIIYTYFGYPVLIYLISRIWGRMIKKGNYEPSVSVIISAFNEERDIERKLVNLLNMDYPEDKIEILVGSDGAHDKTDAIISKFQSERVRFFRFVSNQGKPHVLNALVREAHGNVILFTDARQEFSRNSVRRLVENFQDPKVGCVSGELYFKDIKTGVSKGMDAYWKYEKFLRKCESDLHSMLGATGAIYAIRRRLYSPVPNHILVDDMYIPLSIVRKGYRAVFDKTAHAFDRTSSEGKQEHKRKVRTLAGNYQIFKVFPDLMNPRESKIAFQLVSHKLLRLWAPFFMMGLFLANLFLLTIPFFFWVWIAQLLFYGLAIYEAIRERIQGKSKKKGIGYIPYTFCLLNYSAAIALGQYLSKKQAVTWEKAYA